MESMTTLGTGATSPLSQHGLFTSGWQLLRGASLTLLAWKRRHQTRSALLDLDPRLLRDIGISVSDARVEAGKPFWID